MAQDAVVQVEEEGVVHIEVPADLVDGAVAEKPGVRNGAVAADTTKSAADEAAAALQTSEQARRKAESEAATERTARLEAQRVADQRSQEVTTLRETAQTQEQEINTKDLTNAQSTLSAAQSELEQAMEAGEFAKAAAAQTKLAKAAAQVDRLETRKAELETRRPITEGAVEPRQQSAIEQYLSTMLPPSQAWLRAHPECLPASVGGNPVNNAKMMKGHYSAIEQGFEPNTPDYFRTIEEHTGHRTVESAAAVVVPAGDPKPNAQPQKQQRAPVPAAPVSRDGPETGAVFTSKSVRLSPEQQDVALFSFPAKQGEEETAWKKRAFGTYATELVKATADGTIGRRTH